MQRLRIAILAGLVLMLVGFGNWLTGRAKVDEHEQILASGRVRAVVQSHEEFSQLTARTNARLLRRLQGRSEVRPSVVQKLDFYQVVEMGGRLMMLLGLFTIIVALIVGWYHRKGTNGTPRVFSPTHL